MSSPDVFAWTRDWALAAGLKTWAEDETSSTNSVAKNDEPPLAGRPTLYLARRQTLGRGRGDHSWTTPHGSSLLSSWSFAVPVVPQPIFSAIVGLALFESCVASWPEVDFNMKAPNDLFIGQKKTAGILIETVDQGLSKRTVIGVGFNISSAPPELDTATCLCSHLREGLKKGLTHHQWLRFLTEWRNRLDHAVRLASQPRLDSDTAERLKNALNRHPLLREPILRVDELGQLHSASRIIHWHEL